MPLFYSISNDQVAFDTSDRSNYCLVRGAVIFLFSIFDNFAIAGIFVLLLLPNKEGKFFKIFFFPLHFQNMNLSFFKFVLHL